MVYAAIRHAPVGAARGWVGMMAARRAVDGFARLVEGPDWLAAVANTTWAAEQALAAVAPRFAVDHPVSAEQIERAGWRVETGSGQGRGADRHAGGCGRAAQSQGALCGPL
jgi:hypothetical protein